MGRKFFFFFLFLFLSFQRLEAPQHPTDSNENVGFPSKNNCFSYLSVKSQFKRCLKKEGSQSRTSNHTSSKAANKILIKNKKNHTKIRKLFDSEGTRFKLEPLICTLILVHRYFQSPTLKWKRSKIGKKKRNTHTAHGKITHKFKVCSSYHFFTV